MILSDALSPVCSEQTLLQVILSMQALHDPFTHQHALRLAPLAASVALQFGWSAQERSRLSLAAVLHDLGKIALPTTLLHKPSPLTSQEWLRMQTHPVIGAQLLQQAGGTFALIAPWILSHHEHWNGGGYPGGLVGERIPLGARVLGVIDAYDAMISSRSYKQPLAPGDAQEELRRCAGAHFDPEVVRVFLACTGE